MEGSIIDHMDYVIMNEWLLLDYQFHVKIGIYEYSENLLIGITVDQSFLIIYSYNAMYVYISIF